MAEFRIDNMTCGGCARAVTNALKAVDGAAEAPRVRMK
jgi:copper chaperone CopZ